LGIDYYLYAASVEEFDKLMEDPELWIDLFDEKGKESKLDMGKWTALTLFSLTDNLCELYDLDALKGFPYFKEAIIMDEDHHDSYYKPDKVKAVAEELKQIARVQFNKAYTGADKYYDDDYTEEGRERFFKWDFSSMIDFFVKAAEKREGIIFSWG
jgi:Domain of unknown function (DUF1877)